MRWRHQPQPGTKSGKVKEEAGAAGQGRAQALQWQHCAISRTAEKKVVACENGQAYNKESVIELLLNKDRSNAPANTEHLRETQGCGWVTADDQPAFDKKK